MLPNTSVNLYMKLKVNHKNITISRKLEDILKEMMRLSK